MSLVPVLDVEAPPPAPPAPPPATRGRRRSLFLVLVTFLLTCSLGLHTAAPAKAWVGAVVPVAKGVAGIIATTVAGEVVVTRADPDAGGDSAKGKWGKRMKGLPGLAAGLLGGMAGWLGLGDMIDGVKTPQEFKDEALADRETMPPMVGSLSNWTISSVDWSVPPREWSLGGTPRTPYPTWRVDGTCAGDKSGCGTEPGQYFSALTGVGVNVKCWNPVTAQFFEQNLLMSMNGRQVGASNYPICMYGSNYQFGSIHSFSVQFSGTGRLQGVTNPGVFYNPNFDQSLLPEQERISVTADGTCRLPDGGTVRVSKTTAGLDVIPTVQCPDGSVPESIDWTSNVGGKQEDLGGVGTDWTPFPACAGFKCEKLITVDDVPCRVGVQECFDWQNVNPPSRVKCEYGPYTMPIADCADLQHLYKSSWGVTQDPAKGPQRQPGWLPSNPDGTVDWTKVGTDWAPEDNPNPDYRPPVRWTPEGPNPSTVPTTPPVTAPSNPPFPTTGVNPPIAPPGVPPPKNPDAPGQNCIAQGWSWNPVDWVYIPVKCALTWAFIPKDGPGLIARAGDTFNGTGMGDWLGIVPAWIDALPDGGVACMGPPLTVPASMGGATYYPLNACSDPMAKYAQMSRAVMTVVVSFAGVISIVNSVTLAFTGYRAFEREGLAIQAAAAKDAERTRST